MRHVLLENQHGSPDTVIFDKIRGRRLGLNDFPLHQQHICAFLGKCSAKMALDQPNPELRSSSRSCTGDIPAVGDKGLIGFKSNAGKPINKVAISEPVNAACPAIQYPRLNQRQDARSNPCNENSGTVGRLNEGKRVRVNWRFLLDQTRNHHDGIKRFRFAERRGGRNCDSRAGHDRIQALAQEGPTASNGTACCTFIRGEAKRIDYTGQCNKGEMGSKNNADTQHCRFNVWTR